MNVAIVGLGYWGANLVRNFNSLTSCRIKYLCDLTVDRFAPYRVNFPQVICTLNFQEILNDKEVDAVVIATPVFSHFQLAIQSLEAGKHVLIEKPITATVDEAKKLIDESIKRNKVLMVDHTFLYTGAVMKMKDLVSNNVIGKIRYLDSTRINLGLFQADINVLWDLAPHDISILNYLVDDKPHSVNATGISHTRNGLENIAYLTVNYSSGFIAHFNCSWTSPVKIRTMLIGGDKKMMVFNDLDPTEKIRVYDSGFEYKTEEERRKILVDYRTGDVFIPKISSKEALGSMAEDFVNSVRNNCSPISDCYSGLKVVTILEAAQKSLKTNGKEILLI